MIRSTSEVCQFFQNLSLKIIAGLELGPIVPSRIPFLIEALGNFVDDYFVSIAVAYE